PTDTQKESGLSRFVVRARILVIIAIIGVTFVLSQQLTSAQESKPGGHVHYTKSAEFDRAAPSGALAPRLLKLGNHQFPVSTTNKDAQLFINQGLNLSYAFNHAESARAFREAARLDPQLAMAYWGQALVLGPNINAAMDPNSEAPALELIKKALELKASATPREQAYIDALAERYSGNAADRKTRDEAYAAAMRKVHERFPDDLDAAALYAEASM